MRGLIFLSYISGDCDMYNPAVEEPSIAEFFACLVGNKLASSSPTDTFVKASLAPVAT